MKAIVLCAGLGTRLRPLTFSTAKHLIPVANKPVLFFGIESLVAVGARRIGIIVSKESRSLIQNAVDDGQRWGAEVTYIEQPQPRGLAHAAQCAQSFVGTDPFVMYLGDNLIPEGLTRAVELFRRGAANALVMLKAVDNPSSFGIAELDGERIVGLVEKPAHPRSNLAIVGGYVFDHNIFESIARIKPSWRNEYEITDAIQDLIERGLTVLPYIVGGWWKDTGKPADILDANRVILQEIAPVVRGTVDSNSRIEGNVSIGQGSEIIGSHIEDSVVMEDSVIRNVRGPVIGSLIGRKVQVSSTPSKGSGMRLLLGDFCETDLP
jgi:glucose-1-phosphate thymidylyltransferase